jgi:hypothetical protein
MISFRYHLVSIVAIFLALGVGLLAGTTVINKQLVKGLKTQTARANQRADQLQAEVSTLQSMIDPLLSGRLAGTNVVIVQYKGTDAATVNQARSSIQTAGGTLAGEFVVTPLMSSPDTTTQAQLASILGVPASTPPQVLSADAGVAIADRMRKHPGRTGQDILWQLSNSGFLTAAPGGPVTPDLKTIGSDTILVALAGGQVPPPVPVGDFMMPMLQEVVKAQGLAAAGQPTETSYEFVSTMRSDSATEGKIVTVDDLDTQVGGVAVVLGLEQLISTGKGGDYGTAGSASSLLPAA